MRDKHVRRRPDTPERKNTPKKEKTNLVGVDEKSRDVCGRCPRLMAEWVHHCGIYEWPQVGGGAGAGAPSLLSDVAPVQVCSV